MRGRATIKGTLLSIYLFNRCEVLNYCAKNAFPMPVFVCGFVCLLHLLKRRIASPAHVLVRFRLFRPPLSCRAIHPTKNSHAGWLATGLLLFPNNSSSATKKSVNINLMVHVIFFYWICWVVFMRFIFGTKFPCGWTSGHRVIPKIPQVFLGGRS